MRRRSTLALALALAAGTARADPPDPPTATELLSARTLAIGAARGLLLGNDGIWLNPAAMAARRRFAAEFQFQADQKSSTGNGTFYGLSAVDSETSSVAAGLAWTHVDLPASVGDRWNLGLATAIGKGVSLGVTGEYLVLYGAGRAKQGNVSAGLFWEASDFLTLGVAGTNLIPTGNEDLAPTGVGAGLAVGNDRLFHVTGDWGAKWDSSGKRFQTWAAGAEVLVADLIPLRAGWTRDEWRGGMWWSAGAGFVTSAGVALDVAYRQAIDGGNNRVLAAGLKVFFKSQ